jgi:tRNA 2-selenouridine synthase
MELAELPARFRFRVLCGRTGSGKSQVLRALAEHGAQIVDLEQLAQHRGSVLGEMPGAPQPPQKLFESRLWQLLRTLDAARPVYVEAESRKVGNLQVPAAMIEAMRASPCLRIEASMSVRVALLLAEYRHFTSAPQRLRERLGALSVHYGHTTIASWCALAESGRFDALVEALLATHYDPSYDRSIARNFRHAPAAPAYLLDAAIPAAVRATAASILASSEAAAPA